MRVGFIGLGNVGGKLAGNLLENSVDLTVHDLDREKTAQFASRGAEVAAGAVELLRDCDVLITCLPSPAASAAVIEELLPGFGPGKTWIEMSTTDDSEMKRMAELVSASGAAVAECPVSGGCHRAATGNISIFAGCDRDTFDKVLPLLSILGRRILHTGPIGTASVLKVMTNYLATANLVSLSEALVTMKAAGLDMATTYEAIRISSGNSFVHETESQLILSGSRNVDFTMDLVQKDIGLFHGIAESHGVPLEISPLLIEIMRDGQQKFGERAQSTRIVERLEQATGARALADGFPAELVDDEPRELGSEVVSERGGKP